MKTYTLQVVTPDSVFVVNIRANSAPMAVGFAKGDLALRGFVVSSIVVI